MPIDSQIVGLIPDGEGQARAVHVTQNGALVTAPLHYSGSVFVELDIADTAYNFYDPIAGKQFVITALIVFADKQVSGTTNASVEVYEAAEKDSLVVDKTLLRFELGQNQLLHISDLNLLVSPGRFITAKTSDDDVHLTMLGYYTPLVSKVRDPAGT